MALGIPLPGSFADALNKGVDTGSSMFARIMEPILKREQLAQQMKIHKDALALQQAAAGRNAQLFPYRLQELKDKHALAEYQRNMMNELLGGAQETQSNNQQGNQYPALNKMFAGQGVFPDGEVQHGNIDLNNRPKVPNPETGGTSTVWSMSIGTPEGEVLIPRVSDDGRILSEQEAIDQFHRTGKHLGIYSSPEEATKAAEHIHEQQAAVVGAKPNNLLEKLKADPLKRATFKHLFKFDPLAPIAQTPEQKNASALDLFQKKEKIKADNKIGSGETLTAPIKTKYQNVIGGVTSARPILKKLIAETKKGNIPGQLIGSLFKRDAQASYKGEVSTLLDGVRNAYTIPNTDSGTAKAEDKVLRKAGESDTNYAKRLQGILDQMDAREKDARTKLSAGNITANAEASPETKIIDGVKYEKIKGEWHVAD